MTISYPLSLPSGVNANQATLVPVFAQTVNESPLSLKQQIYTHSGEKWRVGLQFPALKGADAGAMRAFVAALGLSGTFLWGDPKAATPIGPATGTPVVSGAGQSGKVLVTSGWAASITGILKKGDFFQLQSYLYMVLVDANSDGSGIASLDIFPALRGTIANGAALTTTNPKGTWRLEGPATGWSFNSDGTYNFSLAAVDAI